MTKGIIYQVSTLQALAMGYTRKVLTVGELRKHGDTGLGTFEHVNGEMIVLEGHCYRATDDGTVTEAPDTMGVPFASVTHLQGLRHVTLPDNLDIEGLRRELNVLIEEEFGLNSMHIVVVKGSFSKVMARSEAPYQSQHITLKEVLGKTQKDFVFENCKGKLVCVYYPDYMDGINAPGWHFHFLSEDKTRGGHVFDIVMDKGEAWIDKISRIEIQIPLEAAFDTYSLKTASADEIKEIEQGN